MDWHAAGQPHGGTNHAAELFWAFLRKGATVQIAAFFCQRDYAPLAVECLTFGSPKPSYIRPDGPYMARCINLAAAADPVPCVPPAAQIVDWSGAAVPVLSYFGVLFKSWLQLGRTFLIFSGGITELDRSNPRWNAPPINLDLAAHSLLAYRVR